MGKRRISKAKVRSGWEGRKRKRIPGKKEFCELEAEKARWPGVEKGTG